MSGSTSTKAGTAVLLFVIELTRNNAQIASYFVDVYDIVITVFGSNFAFNVVLKFFKVRI